MKKVLATLLAVLLLTCVFATVAMADTVYTMGWNSGNVYVGKEQPKKCPWKDRFIEEEWKNKGSVTIKVRENGKTVEYNATKWSARCAACDAYYWNIYEGWHWGECRSDHMFTIYVLGEHTHQWDEGKVTTPATCTTEGVKTFKCTVKGCTETKTEPIAAQGHDFTKEDTAAKYLKTAGNCVDEAEYYKSCSRCSESSKGHNGEATFNGDKDLTKHPTDKLEANQDCCESHEDSNCTKHGTRCTACGHFVESTLVGHTFGDWETVTEATETTDGLKKRTCVCGHFETETILATGHTHVTGKLVEAVEPSCNTPGNIAYRECETCHQRFAGDDVDCTTPLEISTVIGDLGGHDFANAEWAVDGEEHVRYCQRTNCDGTTGNRQAHDPEWNKWAMEVVNGKSTQHMRECQYYGCNIVDRKDHELVFYRSTDSQARLQGLFLFGD